MIGYILILILFALLGIAMIFRPHFFWTVSQWLSVRDGEPTDLYIWFVRISGSIFLCSGSGGDWYSAFLLTGAAFP